MITASEIALRVRLTAFENGQPPVLNSETRKRAAQQLIDQRLVEREMDVGRYPRLDAAGRSALLPQYSKTFFHADEAAMNRALEETRVNAFRPRRGSCATNRFADILSLRFRPSVQADDAAAIDERADAAMETWLLEQRKRTRIEYVEKDLQP